MTNDHPPRRHRGTSRVGGDGEVQVEVNDEQDVVPIDLPRYLDLALASLTSLGVRGAAELSLVFVSRDEIAALNELHMGAAGPTDVLSFPIDAPDLEQAPGPGNISRGPSRPESDPSDFPLLLGDVVICPEIAREQAPAHAGNLDDELALLVVHGILHILGHDHAEPEEAERMRREELRLLCAHHWQGPVPDGFRQEHQV